MRRKRLSIGSGAILAIITVISLVASASGEARERVLHNFNGTDGSNSDASLILGAAGHLYGTTSMGGTYNSGAVFELTPKAGGRWAEKVLYNFKNNGRDGVQPSAGLVFDKAGNLYGTTPYGGIYGGGTAFKLASKADGGWTEKVLHNFKNNGRDGIQPFASLIFDNAGNLYGTTNGGGSYGTGGTVFELTPTVDGSWTEKVLHSFSDNGRDGLYPTASLVFDAGNLYGTTGVGGTYKMGAVFELTPRPGGGWTEKVLYSFCPGGYPCRDGSVPEASLIFDSAGNLFGTTSAGGAYDSGTVFELVPEAVRGWREKVLHTFRAATADGHYPYAGVVIDAAGNLYGTTLAGGSSYNSGVVFELTPKENGGWTENLLYAFGKSGDNPFDSLIFDNHGNLYGTTYDGGAYDRGTVLKITP